MNKDIEKEIPKEFSKLIDYQIEAYPLDQWFRDNHRQKLKMFAEFGYRVGYNEALQSSTLKKMYEKWVKLTKRNGAVTFRQSIYEFFEWLEESVDKEGRDLEAGEMQKLIPLVEALVYYSQIHTVKGVIPAGMLPHEDAWREAQKWLHKNCKIVDGEYYLASPNTTMSVPCVTPLYCNNSIEQKAYDTIQDIDLLLDQMPFGKEKAWKEIANKVEAFLKHNPPPQQSIPTCSDCGQYILYDPTTNETKCLCKKSNPTPFNSSKEQDKNLNQS